MDIKLPPIAPKDEIQKYISNIKLFEGHSQSYNISKDIFAQTHYMVKVNSFSNKLEEQEPSIKQIKSIQALTQFFNQSQNLTGEEIPLNDVENIISSLSSSQFGLKIRFAVHVRSLSLIIKYLLSNGNSTFDKFNKNFTQKAIDDIISLPVKPLFFPEIYQHPYFDFEILNYSISSPTSICNSYNSIFTYEKDGTVRRYIKNRFPSPYKVIFKIPNNFGACSMVYTYRKLYFINSNQKCISFDLDTLTISDPFPTLLTYPSISDGYYIYSIIYEKKPRIKIFNQNLEKYRESIRLNLPDSISLSSNMPVSTNGAFINFIDNDKCHIFSIINGRYITTHTISMPLQSIVYDYAYNGFICLSEDGLFEIPSKSTAPPWFLNYQVCKIDNIGNFNQITSNGESNSFKNSILEAIGMLTIQYLGGLNDVPLSTSDEGCLESLKSLLNYLLITAEDEANDNSIITTLCILQIKIRRFSKLPKEIDQSLIQIFSNDRFSNTRRAACFLFLSCLPFFEKEWNRNCTDLLRLMVNDKSCTDLVFSLLTLFSFDVPELDENALLSILNLMSDVNQNQKYKAIIILSTIQQRLIEKLPESEPLFTSYVTRLMFKMTESWTSYLSTGNQQSAKSTTLIAVKALVKQIVKSINKISLPPIVTERFFAVSLIQQMGSDELSMKTQQIFNCLLFFALHFSIKGIETNEFVVCSEKVDRNHPQISAADFEFIKDSSKEIDLLIKCADESNWSDKSEVSQFLKETIGKIENADELEKRVARLSSIQPQPLRKIKHFLLTGEFNTVKHQDSSIWQLMNYAQWIPTSFSRLIIASFLNKFEEFQDDFLCIPRSLLMPFVQSCQLTLLLPLSIIKFSEVKLKESSLDFHDLQCSYEKISQYITKEQSDEFIQPLLNLKTNTAPKEHTIHRAMISAVIGFRKSEMKEASDEIIQKLIYCRKAVSSTKMAKMLLEIVKIFALKGDWKIFNFIIEVIGSCILKKSQIFPNVKNNRIMFQFAFEFVDFSRFLLSNSNEFRRFLSSSEFLGFSNDEASKESLSFLKENDADVIRKIAFLTIVNDIFSFPIVGSFLSAVGQNMEKIESKITKISKNGHKITLENGNTYDIRNLFQYNVISPHHVDCQKFDDDQIERILDFFNQFPKYFKLSQNAIESSINNSEFALKLKPLVNILYFTSLECLSFNTKFTEKFHGIYSLSSMIDKIAKSEPIKGDELIYVEPINDKTVSRRFWEFYSQPTTKDFSIFEAKDGYSISPISPTTHFSARFRFSNMCEVTLYCCFPNTRSMSEMRSAEDYSSLESFEFHELNEQALVYQTVTFSDYFDFVLDADSQQVSMISQDKTVNYPMYNSAIFYSIFIKKATNLTFELKNEQWLMEKLNSFEFYDFSSFNLCRFGHPLTIPSKAFENSFLNELAIVARNLAMKTIVPNMLKVKQIDPALSVSYIVSITSNFQEIFKGAPKLKTRMKGKVDLSKNLDIEKMSEIFLLYAKNTLSNVASHVVWRNNSYAMPVKKGSVVCNCVIFSQDVIKVADEKTEVEFDCFIVPKEHLNRTAVQLLMFSKNALIFFKETNNIDGFNKIVEIMRTCQKEKIPGFTNTDLKSVDTVIKEVEEMFEE